MGNENSSNDTTNSEPKQVEKSIEGEEKSSYQLPFLKKFDEQNKKLKIQKTTSTTTPTKIEVQSQSFLNSNPCDPRIQDDRYRKILQKENKNIISRNENFWFQNQKNEIEIKDKFDLPPLSISLPINLGGIEIKENKVEIKKETSKIEKEEIKEKDNELEEGEIIPKREQSSKKRKFSEVAKNEIITYKKTTYRLTISNLPLGVDGVVLWYIFEECKIVKIAKTSSSTFCLIVQDEESYRYALGKNSTVVNSKKMKVELHQIMN